MFLGRFRIRPVSQSAALYGLASWTGQQAVEGALKRRCTKFLLSAAPFSCGAAIVPQPLSMSSLFEEAYAESDADFSLEEC